MNTFKPVEYVKGWCYHVLPLVYDDSLSYEEQICKLTNAVNQCITNINNLPEIVEEAVREFVETQGLENIVRDVFAELVFINVKNPPEDMTPAKGDSLTDDTEALQTLINYAGKNNGILFFPAGNYMVKSLTLPNNATLMGYDRYKTTLVLIGGTNASMFTGNISNCTIANIGFNGNRTVQTLHEPLFNCTVNNALISNVLLSNANTLGNFTKADNSHSQFSDIVCNNFNDAIFINGNSPCSITNILFTMDTGSANTLINIDTNNSIYGIFSNTTTNYGIVCTGVGNTGTGTILNASTALQNTLPSNNFNIMGTTQSFNITNNLYNEISGTREEITKNNKINNVGGNETSSITGDYQLTANNIFLNPANPLKYGTVQKLNENFNYVEAQDKNNNPYKILVEGNELPNPEPEINTGAGQELATKRVGRWLLKNLNSTDDNGETVNYIQAQGSVVIESTNRIIIAYIPFNTASFKLSNDVMLREYNLSNGNLIREQVIPNGGHANGIGYNPNNNTVYLAQCFMWTSKDVNSPSKTIITVNYDTFTVKGSITINSNLISGLGYVSYDNATNKMYAGTNSYLFEIDPESGAIKSTTPITDSPQITKGEYNGQSGCVYNGKLYQVHSTPEMLKVNDGTTGEFISLYNLPYYGQRMYAWGESESCSVLSNGDIYILTWQHLEAVPRNEIVQIFKTNINQSVSMPQPLYQAATYYSTLYVNSNNFIFNPDGSEDAPFNEPNEAIMIKLCETYTMKPIRIIFTKGTYTILRAYNVNNLDIQGNDSEFEAIMLSRCSNIHLSDCIVTRNNYTDTTDFYHIYQCSLVKLNDCWCKNNSSALSKIPASRGIYYIESSTVTWTGGINPTDNTLLSITDYTKKTCFSIGGSIFNNGYRFKNMNFRDANVFIPTPYVLWDGSLNAGSNSNLNAYIMSGAVTVERLKNCFQYITFVFTLNGSRRCYKCRYDNGDTHEYSFNLSNLSDSISTTSGAIQHFECRLTLTNTNISYTVQNGINIHILSDSSVEATTPASNNLTLTSIELTKQ